MGVFSNPWRTSVNNGPESAFGLAWRMAEVIASAEGKFLGTNASQNEKTDRAYVLKLVEDCLKAATLGTRLTPGSQG